MLSRVAFPLQDGLGIWRTRDAPLNVQDHTSEEESPLLQSGTSRRELSQVEQLSDGHSPSSEEYLVDGRRRWSGIALIRDSAAAQSACLKASKSGNGRE